MFSRAALAVFVTVVAEILLFGYVAQAIGALAVVLLIIGATVAGMSLLRSQLASFGRPGSDLGGRGLRILAAVLLIIPGFLTGALGLLLLVPPIRTLVLAKAQHRVAAFAPQAVQGFTMRFPTAGPFSPRRDVVDVDVVDSDVVDADTHLHGKKSKRTHEDTPSSAPPELN